MDKEDKLVQKLGRTMKRRRKKRTAESPEMFQSKTKSGFKKKARTNLNQSINQSIIVQWQENFQLSRAATRIT